MRKALHRALIAFLLILLITTTGQAWAWGSPGHMAVAYIAYQQLTPDVKARALQLLALNPNYSTWKSYIPAGTPQEKANLYLFMMAATWPDEIKANHAYTGTDNPPDSVKGTTERDTKAYDDMLLHKYWHFVDQPTPSSGPAAVTPDAITQINAFRDQIASDAIDPIKSYDLVWLEHLVGDIHQPLHCTTRYLHGVSDRGGNNVTITNTGKELHTFWDDLPGTGETKNYATAVRFATPLPAASATAASDTEVNDWAQESLAMADADAYHTPIKQGLGPYTITTAYKTTALADARLRIALAGARLANLLNANLK